MLKIIKTLTTLEYHKELVETLLKSYIGPISSNLIVPLIMYFMFKDSLPIDILYIWIFANIILFILRIVYGNKILKILDAIQVSRLKTYMNTYIFLVFLSAILWGIFFTFSLIYMNEVENYIVLAILLGFLSGSTTTLSSVFHASFIFTTTIMIFIIFNLLYFANLDNYYFIALLLMLFTYVVSSANYKMYKLLSDNINQKYTSGETNKLLTRKVKEAIKDADLKEQLIQKQSALVQMGEMISMIAHQWRQPLGAIVAVSIDLKMQMELESFDLEDEEQRLECKKYFSDSLKDIDSLVQNMTTTIDDFRNFYKPNKAHSITSISVPIQKAINIVKNSFKTDGITIVENYDSNNEIDMYVNEMMQVILNILKNAQDNFKEKKMENKSIFFICKDIDDKISVEICDNGGGIKDDVLPKVFNPYFSTKDEKNGTGLGLYMSKIIIEEHHCGRIGVYNANGGACFLIELNKKIK